MRGMETPSAPAPEPAKWYIKALAVIGGGIGYALFLGVILVVLLFGFKAALAIYPIVADIADIGALVGIPVGIVCALIPKTRIFAGQILSYGARPVFFSTWLACFIYAFQVSSTFCVLVTIMGGFGVMPLAFVELLWHRDWYNLTMILENLAVWLVMKAMAWGTLSWHLRTMERAAVNESASAARL